MKRDGYDSLYDILDAKMDPDFNKFQLVSPAHVPPAKEDSDGNELWIGGGDVLMIQIERWREDLFKQLGIIKG